MQGFGIFIEKRENKFLNVDQIAQKIKYGSEEFSKQKLAKISKQNNNIDVKEGDVFQVAQLNNPNTYFYGEVLLKENNGDPAYKNGTFYILVIFTCRSNKIGMDDYKPNYNSLICSPFISTSEIFDKGLAKIVGNKKVNDYRDEITNSGVYNFVSDKQISFIDYCITRTPKSLIYRGPNDKEHIALMINIRGLIQPSIFDVSKQDEDSQYNIYNYCNKSIDNVFPVNKQNSIQSFRGKKEDIYFECTEKREKYFYQCFPKITENKQTVKIGDIFVVCLNKKVYYYGKVINYYKDIRVFNAGGIAVVEIFQNRSTDGTIDGYKPNYNKLMTEPAAIYDDLFTEGYLKIIGNEEINKKDLKNDVGFYSYDLQYKDEILKKDIESKKRITGVSLPYGIFLEILCKTIKKPRLKEPEGFIGFPSMKYVEFLNTEDMQRIQDFHEGIDNDELNDVEDTELEFVDNRKLVSKLNKLFKNLHEYAEESNGVFSDKEVNQLKEIMQGYTDNIKKMKDDMEKITSEIERVTLEINDYNDEHFDKSIIETEEREILVLYICNLAYNYGLDTKEDLTGEYRDW